MAARRRPATTPPARKEESVHMKCTAAYKDWLVRFGESNRLEPVRMIDKALAALAKAEGFEPPPRR
jgi:hypothetical protein